MNDNKATREYGYIKRSILADGTIREYKCKTIYTLVDKSAKITKGKVIEKVKTLSPEKLREVYEFMSKDE